MQDAISRKISLSPQFGKQKAQGRKEAAAVVFVNTFKNVGDTSLRE